MKLIEVKFIRRSKNYRNDVVLGERPNDPLTADDYIGQPFEVDQVSTRIVVQNNQVPEGQTWGHQTEYWRCKRTRGDKSRSYVYDNSFGSGIPTRYFVEVK